MKHKAIKLFVTFLIAACTTHSNAYEPKSCMQGIERSFMAHGAALDEANNKMSDTMLALLNSGVATDDSNIAHLSNLTTMASLSLGSAYVVSIMRKDGTFKQASYIDGMVRVQHQIAFNNFSRVKGSYVKFAGALKNQSLREQAFQVFQEIEKISFQLQSCEK